MSKNVIVIIIHVITVTSTSIIGHKIAVIHDIFRCIGAAAFSTGVANR